MSDDRPPSRTAPARTICEYVERAIEDPLLQARIVHVLLTMPARIVDGLLNDPCFRIALDNHVPGRGSTVWMACPAGLPWTGSRSVVLRRRLIDATEGFAHYVIAHEFAHAHLWNGGWGDITDPEQAADALAASWGFLRPG